MINISTGLIKEFKEGGTKYSYKLNRSSWFYGEIYGIMYDTDCEVLTCTEEQDAFRMTNLLNSIRQTSFLEGVVKAENKMASNPVDFMKWTSSEVCLYRTAGGNMWFNIQNMNEIIYKNYLNEIKKD